MTRAAWAEAEAQLRRDGHHELASNLEQEIHQLHQKIWNKQTAESPEKFWPKASNKLGDQK